MSLNISHAINAIGIHSATAAVICNMQISDLSDKTKIRETLQWRKKSKEVRCKGNKERYKRLKGTKESKKSPIERMCKRKKERKKCERNNGANERKVQKKERKKKVQMKESCERKKDAKERKMQKKERKVWKKERKYPKLLLHTIASEFNSSWVPQYWGLMPDKAWLSKYLQ